MSTHPTQIGKYSIDGLLGSGAWGMVYQATDPMIQRKVALKTIHRSLLEGDNEMMSIAARFKNEAQAGGRLSHPGIVSVYEYGTDGDTAFIAMEFVEGQDLSKVLAAHPTMSEPMLLQVMDQLLLALHHAHGQGVWHRDIKPANLIMTKDGQLKITDFGIARIRDAALTQVTSMIGTHGYMAPEQYRGQDIDHRVDVFAAGVLLYRLLTGKAPFSGSPETIMYKVLNEDPPAPSTIGGIARTIQVDSVIGKALAKDVRDRYATAGAFREALRANALRSGQGNPVIASVLQGDETVIDPQAMQALHAAPGTQGTGGWTPEMLVSVEQALASFIGPLAKVLVKKASEKTGDYQALIGAVAGHLNTNEERSQFLAKVQGGTGASQASRGDAGSHASTRGTGAQGSLHPSSSARTVVGTQALAGGNPVTPEFLAHVQRVLASQMGPLASVVVKRAAAKASGREDLIGRLIDAAPDGVDKIRLGKELRSGA